MHHNHVPEAKMILLHPPKTGGTSLAYYLFPWLQRGFSNAKPEEIKHALKQERWDEAKKIITVREPFQRCVSAYKFFCWVRRQSFDEWLEHGKFKEIGSWHAPCARWLPDGDVYIYKTEELSQKFPGIRQLRKTSGPTWQELWTPERQKIISERYAEDYERFQYATPTAP